MVLTRLLLLIAIGVIVYMLLRRWLLRKAERGQPRAFQPMVSCKHCGLHLPRDNAIERDGQYFCSRAHAEASGQ